MGVDRRRVLAGIAVAGLSVTGCDLLSPEPPPPHPLAGLLDQTRALLARYEAVGTAHPGLAERLSPLRDDHQAHVTELARLVGPTASSSPSAAPDASAPEEEAAALDMLADAERTGQEQATQACLAAKTEYAGLVGSIAACRAVHRAVLS